MKKPGKRSFPVRNPWVERMVEDAERRLLAPEDRQQVWDETASQWVSTNFDWKSPLEELKSDLERRRRRKLGRRG